MDNTVVDSTLQYYNDHAEQYFDDTVSANMSPFYDRFLKYVKPHAHICDLGCGSGRDSKKFLEFGYSVTSIDGSYKMCKLAQQYLGKEVYCIRFCDLALCEIFDAVWACSSLLHVPYAEMRNVFDKLILACKNEAVIFACFKYGVSESKLEGKLFSNYTEDMLNSFLHSFKSLTILDEWVSFDVLRRNNIPQWVNVILKVHK